MENISTHVTFNAYFPSLEIPKVWAIFDSDGFTINNSSLISDFIYDIAFDEVNGRTYLATEEGISILNVPFSQENTELDVYYEASHAIPMQLKKGDTLSYAPLKSKVSTESINLDGDLIPNPLTSDLDGATYSNVMVGGAEYIEN